MRWFAGLYVEDNTWNVDLQASLLMQWPGLDQSIVAVNLVSPYRNQGQYGGLGSASPTQDAIAGVGIRYTSG